MSVKIKWCFGADNHFKSAEPFGKPDKVTGINTRTIKKLEMLRDFLGKCRDLEVDFAVLAGDIFDGANPPQSLRYLVANALEQYIQNDLRIIYIPGNHDHNGSVGAWQSEGVFGDFIADENLLMKPGGFYYIDKVKTLNIGGLRVLVVPYYDRHKIIQYIPGIRQKYDTPDILFSHFYVENASVAKSNRLVILKGKGFPFKNLLEIPLVQLGDIHKAQKLDNNYYGVYYPGCMSRVDISDGELNPGFLYTEMMISESRETAAVKIDDCSVKFEKLTDWSIDRIVITEENYPDINEFIGEILSYVREDICDIQEVTFRGSKWWLELIPYNKIRKIYIDFGVRKFIWHRETIMQDDLNKEIVQNEEEIGGTLKQRWESYASAFELNVDVTSIVSDLLE